jgi:hypothetical protein
VRINVKKRRYIWNNSWDQNFSDGRQNNSNNKNNTNSVRCVRGFTQTFVWPLFDKSGHTFIEITEGNQLQYELFPENGSPEKIDKDTSNEIPIEDIFEAYYDCRKHNRNRSGALQFEVDLEKKLIDHKPDTIERNTFISSVNSYLGILKHYKTFKVRRLVLYKSVSSLWYKHTTIGAGYKKINAKGGH